LRAEKGGDKLPFGSTFVTFLQRYPAIASHGSRGGAPHGSTGTALAVLNVRYDGSNRRAPRQAYFNEFNAEGGIKVRKINFISYDDSYSPPKTVEQVRKLVENDEVLLIFSLGTPPNLAIHKYLNGVSAPYEWAPNYVRRLRRPLALAAGCHEPGRF
jgi:hypothetical protein